MARCRTIDGDYEICPRNPIVSHRHLPLEIPIAVTGHADITDTQNGEWWMVLLAVRPYTGGHYNIGRETFMIPMVWDEDGWPRIDNANGMVNERERLPRLPETIYPPLPASDNFDFLFFFQASDSISGFPKLQESLSLFFTHRHKIVETVILYQS